MMARLAPLDTDLLEAAVAAYRGAVEYCLHVEEKWEKRGAELRRLDGFHRTRVSWENDGHRADRLYERAVEYLKVAARGGTHVFVDSFDDKHVFTRCKERQFRKVLDALAAIRARIEEGAEGCVRKKRSA
jgi:hypothetical protein